MSINVKSDLPRIDKLRQIMEERQGLLLTSDLAKFNIPRTYLSIMEQNGEIERVSRGVYRSVSAFIEDELFSFQSRYSSTIFSHETALYLYGLIDRTPLTYSISVPSGYHSHFLNNSGHKIFYVNRDLFDLCITSMNTPHGNKVRTTDLERTICDQAVEKVTIYVSSVWADRGKSPKTRRVPAVRYTLCWATLTSVTT
jgi:predicted transcriptional regulator of viral defense system